MHVYSDNTGAEANVRHAAARQFDHTCVSHSIWKRAVLLDLDLTVFRVPSDENLADLPSRRAPTLHAECIPVCRGPVSDDFRLLAAMGAVWRPPWLDDCFWAADAWEALSIRKILQ